ncbi:Poly-beta-1,6-N-acetyl-D-glucosamine export protein precursor [compost metagenome]
MTRPNWYLDAGVEVYATRNRRSDVPYYSPRSERSLLPSLSWNHTLAQSPTSAWTQFASVGLGGLRQQGFGGSALGVLSYGQRYRFNDVFEVGGTLSATSRSYDGTREREWRIAFDLTQRF